MFKNREEAGKALALKVAQVIHESEDKQPARTVVVAVTRGGIVVARQVAETLCAPLTILVSKTIGTHTPVACDLAAVTSSGVVVLSDSYDDSQEGMPTYVRSQRIQLAKLSKTLETHWLEASGCPQPSFAGRKIILVSDGAVNGLTELAVARTIQPSKPRRLIIAAPVISHAARVTLQHDCDRLIYLKNPDRMKSPAEFYEQFEHIDEKHIVAALKAANKTPGAL